ncbi:hypothetical protein GCM10009687_59040 [Asanoa iriomotensis]|uniref:Uncharacterized protein n=1 Tax=Asanoa iriomotensis TaxID=234613 RepID=A0ABQ4BU95_9ACTN|nr:hypothetical protein Air01nite_01930 [Asanoa iriomotensis]
MTAMMPASQITTATTRPEIRHPQPQPRNHRSAEPPSRPPNPSAVNRTLPRGPPPRTRATHRRRSTNRTEPWSPTVDPTDHYRASHKTRPIGQPSAVVAG